MERLKHLPFEDIGFAKVDHHRALRQGFAEVIFGKGKTPAQVAEIVRAMVRHKESRHNVLVTRADAKMLCGREAREPRREISSLVRRDHHRAQQAKSPARARSWSFPRGPATFPWRKKRC